MKRFFLLAIISLACVKSSEAQHFSHGAGVGVFVEGGGTTEAKASFSLTYSPRFSFAETKNTSLSVGIPLNIGISAPNNAVYIEDEPYQDKDFGYMINVPLMFNFNIGAGSALGCEDRMGFFVGAGYAYHAGSQYEEENSQYGYIYADSRTRSCIGPVGNIGLRISVGYKKKRNIEIRTSYMKGVTSHKPHVFGANCLFNF